MRCWILLDTFEPTLRPVFPGLAVENPDIWAKNSAIAAKVSNRRGDHRSADTTSWWSARLLFDPVGTGESIPQGYN